MDSGSMKRLREDAWQSGTAHSRALDPTPGAHFIWRTDSGRLVREIKGERTGFWGNRGALLTEVELIKPEREGSVSVGVVRTNTGRVELEVHELGGCYDSPITAHGSKPCPGLLQRFLEGASSQGK